MHLVRHTRIPINLPAVIPSSAERGCSAGSHTSPVPFHTPATQHHLTSDRRGEHCVNKHGNGCQLHGQGSDCVCVWGGTHCACSFLLGMKRRETHGGEHGREEESMQLRSLKLYSGRYFLQRWSCCCRIFTAQTGTVKRK